MNINRDKIVQLVDTDTIENLTSALSQRLIADQLRLTTAESCTGGKLASALCAAEDTPKFYGAGFVTFTDQAKMKILSVSQQSLERYSAVSEKVAAEMATGAIERADADGVVCGRGRNPTLRLWPAIFSGEIDVFPSERRNMGQEIGR